MVSAPALVPVATGPAVTPVAPVPPPVTIAAAPAAADPNKAFAPSPDWTPPRQAVTHAVASATLPQGIVLASAPAADVPTPSRTADATKAFVPPPGWSPPTRPAAASIADTATSAPAREAAPVAVAQAPVASVPVAAPAAPSVTVPAKAPVPVAQAPSPSAPEPAPSATASAPVRVADSGKAFVPPPGWVAPSPPSAPQAATPPAVRPEPAAVVVAPPVTRPAPEPAVVTSERAPMVATPVVLSASSPVVPVVANISAAQSGAVSFGDIKSPPFGGPLQVAVIQFGRGSSGLGGNDYDVLARVAQIQRRNGGTIRVVTHADQDSYGASAAQLERGNFEVSRRRALAVAQQLRALGVPKDSIVAEAASDEEPLYQTDTARGMAANRRAEVFIDF